MSRRKNKMFFRKFFLVVVFLLIVYLSFNIIYSIFFDNGNNKSILPVLNIYKKSYLDFNITTRSEEDTESVDYYFMEGMKTSDFKDVLLEKNNYVNSKGKYNKVEYDFEKVLSYSDIENILEDLNKSDIVNLEIIGSSVDNRNIYGIEIGKGDDVLFLDANIHAAEVSTTYILLKYIIDVVNDYEENIDDIRDLLDKVKIVAIPCINPDGYEIYNFGVESLNNKNLWVYINKDNINFEYIKSNANGVDLNRNFPTQYSGLVLKGKKMNSNTSIEKTYEKGKYFNGYSVGSEPEIKAAMYFMIKHYKNVYAYINIHSQGRVLYAGKPNLSNEFNKISSSYAKKISSINKYKVHGVEYEKIGEGNDGSATDFMAELSNGLSFSEITGRLYTNKYVNNCDCNLQGNFPVITMEITKDWTSNPAYFKKEYYNQHIKELFFELLKK